MNITLIHPPITLTNPKRLPQLQPPLGLAYLAATLREAGHDVRVIDATGEAIGRFSPFEADYWIHGLPIDEIVARIDEDADVIGIGIMFSNFWPLSRRLIEAIRRRFPAVPIVCGGEHVTALTELVLRDSPVDFAVVGEGEETMSELVAALDGGARDPESLRRIPGLAFRTPAGDVVVNPRRSRRRALDEIPWPAWDLFPLRRYIETSLFFCMPLDRDQRPMVILATRGCPYTCKFCSNEQMWGTNFFMRDPKRVVDEMEHYVREYGANDFHFQDLTLVINAAWVKRLCREIIDRGLRVTWKTASGTRSEGLDLELLQLMAQSGCDEILLAPDSGSYDIIRVNRKRVNLDKVLAVARMVRDHAIAMRTTGLMIVGYPEERLRDVWRSFRYLVAMAGSGFSTVYINRFTAYPGSEYHDIAVREGRIAHDDDYFLNLERNFGWLNSGISWHPRWSGRFVLLLWLVGYVIFFGTYYLLSPARIFRSLAAVAGNKPQTRFERFFAFLLWQPLEARKGLVAGRRAA